MKTLIQQTIHWIGEKWCRAFHRKWHGWPNSGNQVCMRCAKSWQHEWPGKVGMGR